MRIVTSLCGYSYMVVYLINCLIAITHLLMSYCHVCASKSSHSQYILYVDRHLLQKNELYCKQCIQSSDHTGPPFLFGSCCDCVCLPTLLVNYSPSF